jgi:hypothetical protein
MKISKAGCTLFLGALCIAATANAIAQTSQYTKADCDRAWLGSDWPEVVLACTSKAEDFESYGDWSEKLIAAQLRARTSVAYAKLNRGALSTSERGKAETDLRPALAASATDATTTQMIDRAKALNRLLQSPKFVHDAENSDLLADIQ